MTQYSVLKEQDFEVWQVMISVDGSAPKVVNLFDTEEAANRNAQTMQAWTTVQS